MHTLMHALAEGFTFTTSHLVWRGRENRSHRKSKGMEKHLKGLGDKWDLMRTLVWALRIRDRNRRDQLRGPSLCVTHSRLSDIFVEGLNDGFPGRECVSGALKGSWDLLKRP